MSFLLAYCAALVILSLLPQAVTYLGTSMLDRRAYDYVHADNANLRHNRGDLTTCDGHGLRAHVEAAVHGLTQKFSIAFS